jgi:hypothetical protein
MDLDPVASCIGDRDMRLQWRVHCLLRAEGVLEYLRGFGKGALDIAAPEVKIERDIRVAPSGEVLQIGKGAGGSPTCRTLSSARIG